jgi:hypothetical protein
LQQKGHNADGVFRPVSSSVPSSASGCVHSATELRLFCPICLPEWLAHKRRPHTAFERSTMTAGTSFLVSLGTRRGFCWEVYHPSRPDVSPHTPRAHINTTTANTHGESVFIIRPSASLEPGKGSTLGRGPC